MVDDQPRPRPTRSSPPGPRGSPARSPGRPSPASSPDDPPEQRPPGGVGDRGWARRSRSRCDQPSRCRYLTAWKATSSTSASVYQRATARRRPASPPAELLDVAGEEEQVGAGAADRGQRVERAPTAGLVTQRRGRGQREDRRVLPRRPPGGARSPRPARPATPSAPARRAGPRAAFCAVSSARGGVVGAAVGAEGQEAQDRGCRRRGRTRTPRRRWGSGARRRAGAATWRGSRPRSGGPWVVLLRAHVRRVSGVSGGEGGRAVDHRRNTGRPATLRGTYRERRSPTVCRPALPGRATPRALWREDGRGVAAGIMVLFRLSYAGTSRRRDSNPQPPHFEWSPTEPPARTSQRRR